MRENLKFITSCVDLRKQVGFEELKNEDVEEFLESCPYLAVEDLKQVAADGHIGARGDEDDNEN